MVQFPLCAFSLGETGVLLLDVAGFVQKPKGGVWREARGVRREAVREWGEPQRTGPSETQGAHHGGDYQLTKGPGRGRRGSDAHSGPTGRTEVSRERPGARTPGVLVDLEVRGDPGTPSGRGPRETPGGRRPRTRPGHRGSAGRPGPPGGKEGRKGVRPARPRTGRPPASHPPLGKGSAGPDPGGAHARQAAAPTDYPPPSFPVPARGPRPQRGGGRRGRCGGHPNARRRAGGAPPLHRSRRPGRSSARTPYDGGGTGTNPRRPAGRPAGGGARDPPTDRAPPPPPPRGGQGWGKRPREGSGDREAGPWRGRRTNTRLPPRQGRRDA